MVDKRIKKEPKGPNGYSVNSEVKRFPMPTIKRKRFGYFNILRYLEYFTLINLNFLILSYTLRMWI